MTAPGLAVYAACVDFLLALAGVCHMTYRDANALLFFVAWPLATLGLTAWWAIERGRLRRVRGPRPGEGTLRYPGA